MASYGGIGVVVGVYLPHVVCIGRCCREYYRCRCFHEIHVEVDAEVSVCLVGVLLPHEYVVRCRPYDAQLAVYNRSSRELVSFREVFFEEHCAVGFRNFDVVVDAYLFFSVALAVVFAHAHLAELEVASPLVDEHIIYICACVIGSCHLYAHCEFVGVVECHLSPQVDVVETGWVAVCPYMWSQARIVALRVQLPEVEVAAILHGEAQSGGGMLNPNLSFYSVVAYFFRRFVGCQVAILYPLSSRPSCCHESSVEECRLCRCCFSAFVVADGDAPVVACCRLQFGSCCLDAHRGIALYHARVEDNVGAVGVGGDDELVGCLHHTALVRLQLPREVWLFAVNAARILERFHAEVIYRKCPCCSALDGCKQHERKDSFVHVI